MAKRWMHSCEDCGVLISKKYKYCTKHNGNKYSKPVLDRNKLFSERAYQSKYKNVDGIQRVERGCKLDD